MKLLPLFLCAAALACAQCPGTDETDANKAPAATLASLLGIQSAEADKVEAEIRASPLSGFADLAELASRHKLNVPAQLVVCAIPFARKPRPKECGKCSPSIETFGEQSADALNVNSASEAELADLKACGVSDKEIHEIALFNMKDTRFSSDSLRQFLSKHSPTDAGSCDALNFKFSSR